MISIARKMSLARLIHVQMRTACPAAAGSALLTCRLGEALSPSQGLKMPTRCRKAG